ncbi:hypothetical protein Sste5346_008887 [Sporothrix stenoceras]|uniref:Carboxylesterase type B domain-containing protein n=1 Tax=Sporothrix stenoceras TaxID=5173 RepID=A0ABR3YME5_9PEZI
MDRTSLSLFGSNGSVADASNFPLSEIVSAYGIKETLDTPAAAVTQWAEFMADVAFRVPPLHVTLAHRTSNVLVYNIEATNPYPNWTSSYGRANHAIHDLFLFNTAEDHVASALREGYHGTVVQIQSAWLSFCHAIKPWEPLNRDDGSLGPIFTFHNGPAGSFDQTLEDVVGKQTATRWRNILESEATV